MYNILIATRNINFAKSILPELSNTIENLKITNITTTEKETVSSIISGNIDIIIFDNQNKKLNIINVLNLLYNSFLFPFPTFITLSKNGTTFKHNNNLINIIMKKDTSIRKLVYNIKNIITRIEEKHSKEYYENKLSYELSSLGFNLTHKGTIYLINAILITKLCRNEDFTSKLEKNIYPIIAEKYNTTVFNVKSNILKSINFVYKSTNINIIQNYFKIFDKKITPKLLIFLMTNKI